MVVGTHGRKGAAHFFLGSVAEDVARSCPCPVVVTRGVPFPEDGLDPRRRLHLMLAVDGSAGAEAALGWAKTLRAKLACNVTLVQPCWPPAEAERFGLAQAWAGGRQIHPSLLPLLDRELRRWAGEFPGEGEVHCRFPASHGRIAEDLATEAEVLLPDLVVLGVTRRPFGGLSGLTTQGALHAIKIPVVCVPEGMRPPPADGIPVVATVLVGTDMSDFSNQAIAGAYSLLRGTGGSVEICFVYERGAGSESAMDLPAESPPLPSLKDEIELQLRQLIPREAAALGIRTHGERRRGQLGRGRPAARGRAHRRRRAGGGLARQGGDQADADRLGRRSRRPPQHPPGAGAVPPPALDRVDPGRRATGRAAACPPVVSKMSLNARSAHLPASAGILPPETVGAMVVSSRSASISHSSPAMMSSHDGLGQLVGAHLQHHGHVLAHRDPQAGVPSPRVRRCRWRR